MKKFISRILIVTMVLSSIHIELLMTYSFAETVRMTVGNTILDLNVLQNASKNTGDDDGDGLYNASERVLGTAIDREDSDGDGLSDLYELENGMDPTKEDTNSDGLDDLSELIVQDGKRGPADLDTDSDGIPNVLDDDNDGDGVKDYQDISPFTYVKANRDKSMQVVTRGKNVELTIQIAPTQLKKLYESNQVMNWPVDKYGQITDIDGTKDDLKVMPMLQVEMTELPSAELIQAYGYGLKPKSNEGDADVLWVPLNYMTDQDNFVGLEGHLVVEKNTGIENGDGTFTQEIFTELIWALNGQIDPIAFDFGNDIVFEVYDQRDGEYETEFIDERILDMDLGIDRYGNLDLAVDTIHKVNEGSKVFKRTYSNISYDAEESSMQVRYDASSYQMPYVIADESVSGQYADLYKHSSGGYEKAKGMYDYKALGNDYAYYIGDENISLHFLNESDQEISIVLDGYNREDIMDTAAYFREDGGLYYLIDRLEKNEHGGWKGEHINLLSISPEGKYEEYRLQTYTKEEGFDLNIGLDLNFLDYNNDGYEDMLLTDRKGYMFLFPNGISGDYMDRKIMIPDRRILEDVVFQKTQVIDLNEDGYDELVSIHAIKSDADSQTTSLKVNVKSSIESRNEILATQVEAFNIIGIQAEEIGGVKSLVTFGDTEELMKMTVFFNETYLKSKLSPIEAVQGYEKDMGVSFSTYQGSHEDIDIAMYDIAKAMDDYSELSKRGIQSMTILFEEHLSYKTLSDLDVTTGRLDFDFSNHEEVTKKSILQKWVKNGQFISAEDLKRYIVDNPDKLESFAGSSTMMNEYLQWMNVGKSSISVVEHNGESVIPEIITIVEYSAAKLPGNAAKGVEELIFSKKPVFPINDIPDDAFAKVSRYHRVGKISKAFGTLGIVIDAVSALHHGILYGSKVAERDGMVVGILVGSLYAFIKVVETVITGVLIAIGPVGWAVMALYVLDSMLGVFIEGYDPIVGKAITGIVTFFYDNEEYPGTYLHKVRVVDHEMTIEGEDRGYILGTVEEQDMTVRTTVRAITSDTPANKKKYVEECYAEFDINYEGEGLKIKNKDEEESPRVYRIEPTKVYWYKSQDFDIYNRAEFNEVGMNIPLKRKTIIKTKLIDKLVIETRFGGEKEVPEYVYDTDVSYRTSYYDIIPRDLGLLKASFNMIKEDREPDLEKNEIAYVDYDGDGLYIHGDMEITVDGEIVDSDPNLYDTDSDGLSDMSEVIFGTDPRMMDTDSDGVSDLAEYIHGTSPLGWDTDSDGLMDFEEIYEGHSLTLYVEGQPVYATVYSDPTLADTDGDGISDAKELSLGLNPSSKQSNGQVLYDLNMYAPEVIVPIEDKEVVAGNVIEVDFKNHFVDRDNDEINYYVDKGVVNGDVWTYTYTGEIAVEDIHVTADDGRNGLTEVHFRVGDTSYPSVQAIEVETKNERWTEGGVDAIERHIVGDFKVRLSMSELINYSGQGIIIQGNGFNTECNVEVIDNVVELYPKTDVPFDGKEYEILLTQQSISDMSALNLAEDKVISFTTKDTSGPELISTTKEVALNQPVVLTFNEAIQFSGKQIGVQNTATKETYLLDAEKTGDREISLDLGVNVLEKDTMYQVMERYSNAYDFSRMITDANNNSYENKGSELDGEVSKFQTGELSGPKANLIKTMAFGQNLYCVEMVGDEIHIDFDKDIFEGKDFKNIVLHADRALTFWPIPQFRQLILQTGIPYEASISGSRLTIVPGKDMSLSGYSLYIPAEGVVDENGVGILKAQDYDPLLLPNLLSEENLNPMVNPAQFGPMRKGEIVLNLPSTPSMPSIPDDLPEELPDSLPDEVGENLPTISSESLTQGVENLLGAQGFENISPETLKSMNYKEILETLNRTELSKMLYDYTLYDAPFEVVYVKKRERIRPEIIDVKGLTTDAFDAQVEAILHLTIGKNDSITPSKTLMVIMNAEVAQGSNGATNAITLTNVTSGQEIKINEWLPLTNASAGIGSYALIAKLDTGLERDMDYELMMPSGVVSYAGSYPMVNNVQQTYTFTTNEEWDAFSDGQDMTVDSFISTFKVGNNIYLEDRYKQYMNLMGFDPMYKWYVSETPDFDDAKIVSMTQIGILELLEEYADHYIFLKVLVPSESGGSEEILSPALGPVIE